MRLFVAIEAPPAWREYGAAVQRRLAKRFGKAVRLVAPENMHLTLRYIGEVDELDSLGLQETLARRLPPIEVELKLDRVGTFGAAARTSSAWLGIAGDLDALRQLHQRANDAVEEALSRPFEEQRYTPHVTLARVRNRATVAERRAFAEYVGGIPVPASESFIAREALLIRSHLSGIGPRYEILATLS